jgi:glycosyltransferase involved in cell wall biosynthesis
VTRDGDLVVLSHLRWTFVWQRPQHLVSRLTAPGGTGFVEEPVAAGARAPRLAGERHGRVSRAWLEVGGDADFVGFDDPAASGYADALVAELGHRPGRTVWIYTPMALPIARALRPEVLVYDVMDDLAAFRFARPGLRELQRQALAEADVVFTGGRSLHAGVRDLAPGRTFLFPSGVEPEHYARARRLRRRRERPVAGYVGVIDERIDLDLVRELADRLPGWDIAMVGPVVKIDPADLPRASNVRYPGMQPYDRLPAVMAGFDVALMPFALNEATRSISPTKTLEYLAAGLPVVSTRVPDVVADYRSVVDLRDDAAGFAEACVAAVERPAPVRDAGVRRLLRRQHWDAIAARMAALVERAGDTRHRRYRHRLPAAARG